MRVMSRPIEVREANKSDTNLVSMSGLSVVVVGDTMCGKTQLINRFANRTFDQVTILLYFKKTPHA